MNHTKRIISVMFCLPFLLASSSTFAMLTLSKNKVTTVKKIQRNNKSTTTVASLDAAIDAIKNNVYQESVKEIQHITNAPYDCIHQTITKQRTRIKEALQQQNNRSPKIHDKDLPPHVYQDVISIMHQEEINPDIINLHYNTSPERPSIYAGATSGFLLPHFSTYRINPCLIIYKTLLERQKNEQFFIYTHELQHILLGHGSLPITCSEKLISLYEREADLHAASKNVDLAYTGMKNRCINYHPDIINKNDHSKEMIIMYALMREKELLLQNKIIE